MQEWHVPEQHGHAGASGASGALVWLRCILVPCNNKILCLKHCGIEIVDINCSYLGLQEINVDETTQER